MQQQRTKPPLVVKRKNVKSKGIITIKKEHGRSGVSRKSREPSLICSNKIATVIKGKIMATMDPQSLAKVCMVSKNCQELFCQNKRVWDYFALIKFDTIAPEGVNYFEYYYGREIYFINYKETTNISDHYSPYNKPIKSFKKGGGFLDFNGIYTWRSGYKRPYKSIFVGLNAKFYGENYVLVNETLYQLIDGQDVKLLEILKNVKYVCEHEVVNELCIMTKNGIYIHNHNLETSRHHQGLLDQMIIEHGKNDLHVLKIILNNVDYSSQTKYVKFSNGSNRSEGYGLICLESGVLYYFEYTFAKTIQYYQVAVDVRLANFLSVSSRIYWVDDNLNSVSRAGIRDENANIVEKTRVYPTTVPITQLKEAYEYTGGYLDTMFILNQNNELYVHGTTPNLNIIDDIHIDIEEPELILTNVLDFYTHSDILSLYVLTY